MSARTKLAGIMTPRLPKRWKLVDDERAVDEVKVPHVMLRQHAIEPAPNAMGSLITTMIVTLISPQALAGDYEDALDEQLRDLLDVIDDLPEDANQVWIRWTKATKAVFDKRYPSYDIELQLITPR